jgi:hypothetical protein
MKGSWMISRDLEFNKVEICTKMEWIMRDKEISFKKLAERIGINQIALKNAMDVTCPSIPFLKTQERINEYIQHHYKDEEDL